MKTLEKNGEIKRVKDVEVNGFVKYGWKFCPKSTWKAKVRDAHKNEIKETKAKEAVKTEVKKVKKNKNDKN